MLSRRTRTVLMTALLLLVAWSRVWAGIPEAVVHDGPSGPQGHEEVRDHLLSVSVDLDEHVSAAGEQEHQHHLHICGCGVALVSALELDWSAVASPVVLTRHVVAPIKRVDRLLRPPIV